VALLIAGVFLCTLVDTAAFAFVDFGAVVISARWVVDEGGNVGRGMAEDGDIVAGGSSGFARRKEFD